MPESMTEEALSFIPGRDWAAPDALFPDRNEVVLVAAPLEVGPERLSRLLDLLSPQERARYQSFAHEQHRARWGAARGTLREVLGRATGRAPRDIAFLYAAHGK